MLSMKGLAARFSRRSGGDHAAPGSLRGFCRRAAAWIGLATVLSLAACESLPTTSVDQALAAAPAPSTYLLRPGDVVLMEVFQEPYMTTRQRILDDGTILVGMIGRVPITGLSVRDAAQKIARLLDEKQLVNPQVNLTIESYAPRRFVVWGQVRSPGSYNIPGEELVSLPQALAMAGGNTEIGDPRAVLVTRRIGGQLERVKINALSPEAENFLVQEGDIIRVRETIF